MNAAQILIAVAITILAAILGISLIINRGVPRAGKLTPMASVAFALVLAGIIFAETKIAAYGLIGMGLVLAVIDMLQTIRKKKP
ncbi:MAG: hypothetical protein PHG75_06300 [Syntrophomonas sp.]|nr:hypothetical protein [Syntrophomonas sp.]